LKIKHLSGKNSDLPTEYPSFSLNKKRMRNLLMLALVAIVSTQIACQQGGGEKTKYGNVFTNHTKKAGPKASFGETVLINVKTWVNDSLVQSTVRDLGGPREINLPDSSAFKGRVPAVFDALLLMAEGDSATVLQPVDSVMARGIPKEFGKVDNIRYEIVLVDLLSKDEMEKRAQEAVAKAEAAKVKGTQVAESVSVVLKDYKAKKLGDQLQKTASGLEYVILDKGPGAPVKEGDSVPTNYYGVLKTTGKMFDNSYDRGGATPFTVGQLVPGFNEGMVLLNRGGKAIIFIPSALAYGEQGAGGDIPPNSDLVFYIEIEQQ
jgi:FKBP-type peptidyl-prolyl cis-trans isomerase FkpA